MLAVRDPAANVVDGNLDFLLVQDPAQFRRNDFGDRRRDLFGPHILFPEEKDFGRISRGTDAPTDPAGETVLWDAFHLSEVLGGQ